MSNASSKKSELKKPESPAAPAGRSWGIPAALLVAVVGFIFAQLIAQAIMGVVPMILGWEGARLDRWLESPVANFLYVLMTESITIGILLWFTRLRKANFWTAIGLRQPKGGDALAAVGGFLCYIVIYSVVLLAISSVAPINTDQEQAVGFAHNVRGIGLLMAFISLVILPPLVEETVFRGFLYGTLRRRNVSFIGSALLVSLLFGGMHLFGGGGDSMIIWIAFLDTFVLSLVLCYLREKTGSIWASIGVHALKNALVFVNLFIIST